ILILRSSNPAILSAVTTVQTCLLNQTSDDIIFAHSVEWIDSTVPATGGGGNVLQYVSAAVPTETVHLRRIAEDFQRRVKERAVQLELGANVRSRVHPPFHSPLVSASINTTAWPIACARAASLRLDDGRARSTMANRSSLPDFY